MLDRVRAGFPVEDVIVRRTNNGQGKWWQCPGQCNTMAFLYPRTIRTKHQPYEWHYHEGIDLPGTNRSTPIVAAASGQVMTIVNEPQTGFTGYGRCISIRGDDGRYYFYAHCARIRDQLTTQDPPPAGKILRVAAGELIAWVGRTSFDDDNYAVEMRDGLLAAGAPDEAGATFHMGAHLHFEVAVPDYPMGRDEVTTPEGPFGRFRLDPGAELSGGGALPPLLFPDGTTVSPRHASDLQTRIESGPDGYFPIGSAGRWHGGLHLPVANDQKVRCPIDGTIVALRLDPTRREGVLGLGSANFILVRHELKRNIARQLFVGYRGTPAAPRVQGRITLGATPHGPEDVVKALKLMLSQVVQPSTGRPYYFISDNARERVRDTDSGQIGSKLVDAIVAYRADHPIRGQDPRADLVAPAGTWRSIARDYVSLLRAERSHLREAYDERASESTLPIADRPRTVFSLFMNLESADLAANAQDCLWLLSARIPPTQAEVDEMVRQHGQEREEASFVTWRRRNAEVGLPYAQRTEQYRRRNRRPAAEENPRDLVLWVQRRLKRFQLWPGVETGQYSAELSTAIESFLRSRPAYRNSPTQWLNERSARELARVAPPVTAANSSPIDSRFQSLVTAMDSATGTTSVVSGLSIPIFEGTKLFPCRGNVHWEMFAADAILGNSPHFADDVDDFQINGDAWRLLEYATTQALSASEYDIRPNTAEDSRRFGRRGGLSDFYREHGEVFRDCQAKFKSEWSYRPDQIHAAMRNASVIGAEVQVSALSKYAWWNSALGVLPSSPRVWHFNPIHFIERIAELSHRVYGSVRVSITGIQYTGNQCKVRVMSGEREVFVRDIELPPREGNERFQHQYFELEPIPLGRYEFQLVRGDDVLRRQAIRVTADADPHCGVGFLPGMLVIPLLTVQSVASGGEQR